MVHLKIAAAAVAVLFGTAKLCDVCGPGKLVAQPAVSTVKLVQDSATVRLLWMTASVSSGTIPVK